MSHIDDGALHAYLDGESTAVERERLEAHLAGCVACRARLEEEQALIERAGRLLGLATPPERAAPPFHELRRRRGGGGRYRLPLAWAATIALAVGIGWYSRGMFQTRYEEPPHAKVAVESPDKVVRDRTSALPTPSGRIEPQHDQPAAVAPSPAPAPAVSAGPSQLADRTAARAASAQPAPAASAVSRLDAETARPVLRGEAAPSQATGSGIVLTAPEVGIVDEQRVHRMSTSWPIIEPKRARDVLGEDPAVIPGYPVQTLRRNPAADEEILVEQLIDSGVVLLFERRSEVDAFAGRPPLPTRPQAAGKATGRQAGERLARYVRSLRVEIAGPLSADSLSALLGLIR